MSIEQRAELVTQLVPQAVESLVDQMSALTGITGNYILIVMMEFLVYTTMTRVPMEAEPYLKQLIETCKQPDQSDPEFQRLRQELHDIMTLISARNT